MPTITYTDEFKRDGVALVCSGVPQKQVAKDLGMAKTTLQAWVRDARF
ncbi:MAG: transposase, partial [Micrococcus sp.]|nr:transposase [Micrococcus sp.]